MTGTRCSPTTAHAPRERVINQLAAGWGWCGDGDLSGGGVGGALVVGDGEGDGVGAGGGVGVAWVRAGAGGVVAEVPGVGGDGAVGVVGACAVEGDGEVVDLWVADHCGRRKVARGRGGAELGHREPIEDEGRCGRGTA